MTYYILVASAGDKLNVAQRLEFVYEREENVRKSEHSSYLHFLLFLFFPSFFENLHRNFIEKQDCRVSTCIINIKGKGIDRPKAKTDFVTVS